MANLTPPSSGRADSAYVRAATLPTGSADNGAAVLSICNMTPSAIERTLWLSNVPRQELDALSVALRQGPLDGHFFLSLESGFHRTPLAAPMAQALVQDALHGLLPAWLPPAQRAAWRTCLMGLLTLPRAAWEVECVPLRAQLTDAVAKQDSLLAAMRAALYRPMHMSRRDWTAALDTHRARGVQDCREVALNLQRGTRALQHDIARRQLLHWLPALPVAQLDRALAQAGACAAADGAAIDARSALPVLFDALGSDRCALVADGQRAGVLAALERLAGGHAEPLLATGGGNGDRLGRWLLSVAERADPSARPPPSLRAALADALLFAVSAAPGLHAYLSGAMSSGQGSSPMRVRAPVEPGPVASAAAARGGRSLLALAGGLVGGGLGLASLGWRWAFGDTPSAAPNAVAKTVALLDELIERDGMGSIWQAIRHQVQVADDSDAALVLAVADTLEANDVAGPILAALAPAAERDSPAGIQRRRRSADRLFAPIADRCTLNPEERAHLEAMGRALIDAARQEPAPDVRDVGAPADLDVALTRSRILTWVQAMGHNASVQHPRLTAAWQDIAASERALTLAYAALPQLDAHLAQQLTADLRAVTGQSIDPAQIYLNTFQSSQSWPAWEARQLRPPGTTFRNQHRLVPPDRQVRSGLVSAHTLIGAALLPEADPVTSGLYYRSTPETYFPVQECRELTLGQYRQAVRGRDYLGAFRRRYDSCLEQAWHERSTAVSDPYLSGISRRLSGAATLLNAAGQLSDDAAAVVQVLVSFPARFDASEASNGRALALPGRQIDVHALAANATGHAVPLHGVLLVTADAAAEHAEPITLVISDTRTPMVEAFGSCDAALQRLSSELPHQLHARVTVGEHARWQQGRLPVVRAYVIDGDFRWALFMQALELRHAQLRAPAVRSPAQVRAAFNALDAELARLHLPVPVPVLAAAGELAALDVAGLTARSTAHWMARFPPDTPGALRNAGLDGARWLHALSVGRSLVERDYPLLVPFVQQRLDEEIMRRYRIAFDSSCCYVVTFSDGQPSEQAASGWVHNRAQRQQAASFADCAMTRAAGFEDAPARLLGLYTARDSAFFDENSEVVGLEPGQLLSVAREHDVQGDYLAALDGFWQRHEADVLTTLRGGYLYSCWQQHAEGSLSVRGMQLALGVFGNMDAGQSQDPGYRPVPRNGTHAGWLEIHGTASTVLHIADDQGPEVLLYFVHDRNRFHEFANPADMMGWIERAAATDVGRQWLEAAFDLADLQDGWISNGVHTALGNGAQAMFGQGRWGVPIEGEPSQPLVRRLRERARRDAQTLMTSPWEAFRRRWLPRLEQFDAAMGVAGIVLPALLPVVAIGSAAELGLGLEQALDGDSVQQRHAGAGAAAGGLFGLALSAPLGTARLAALAARDGARLQPAMQAAAFEQVADPLQHLAERYAQPVVLAGSRSADNGVHDYLGRQYIDQGGHAYEVAFDRPHGTWRLQNPQPGSFYHQPVRLNADGQWEPHSDVGLRGGAPNSRSHSLSVERSYRGSLNSLVERSRSPSLDGSALDFKWGVDHWERVMTPEQARENMSLQQMKELFVSGHLDPVQQGALSVIIERLDNTLRAERYIVVNEVVQDAVYVAGGEFIQASQTLLGEGTGLATSGMCTGLSRIMATAMGQGEEGHVLDHLRQAISDPDSRHAAALRALVRDAQGAALQPGSMSAASPIGIDGLGDFLANTARNSQFILSGTRHSMACGVNVLESAQREYLLYDPNFGLMVFTRLSRFNQWVNNLFGSRYFSRLSRAVDDSSAETLAEMYGAVTTPGSTRMQFHLRQIHAARMQEQAAARGWNALFEHIRWSPGSEGRASAPLAGRDR
ncbi:hypothetical protein J7J08_01925 [Stenotrophomonas sp. ISL-67]|uniref:dermonecrotic toxin domain-containing protein n=1 Tax=Stenotrophomonas sp. ISL-67 TaxID=2819171 RepID=UPI001BE94DBF|nr:DUF6543 domain-containing protein [Stenotrophomonas sp. ISL-67]MBT2766394.1 hypothetical protein [Stenotrophomonas sp. ISL-67]